MRRGGRDVPKSAPLRHLGPAKEAMYADEAGWNGEFEGGLGRSALGRPMTVVLLNKLDTSTCCLLAVVLNRNPRH